MIKEDFFKKMGKAKHYPSSFELCVIDSWGFLGYKENDRAKR